MLNSKHLRLGYDNPQYINYIYTLWIAWHEYPDNAHLEERKIEQRRELWSKLPSLRLCLGGEKKTEGSFDLLYEVGARIGKGGYGLVYQGVSKTGEVVAIKQNHLDPDKAGNLCLIPHIAREL